MDDTHRHGALNIALHIERLVLEGISLTHRQQSLLQGAVEAELGRLLSGNGLAVDLNSDAAVAGIEAGDIQLSHENDPVRLGQQVAWAVYKGLSR